MNRPSRKLTGFTSTSEPATEAVVDDAPDLEDDEPTVATCDRCDLDALEEDASAIDARLPDDPLCRDHLLSELYDVQHGDD